MRRISFAFMFFVVCVISTSAQTKHESVLKLISLMQQDAMVDKMMNSMVSPMMAQAKSQAKDSVSQAKAGVLINSMIESVKSITKRLINEDMVPLYEKYYSEQDLRAYIQFYESPSGKKMITTMPDMMKDMMGIMMSKYIPEMKAAMESKMKEMVAEKGK